MSRCPECQHENPPGARFCNGCGARAELACAQCGQVNPSGSRFCNSCGAKLGDPARTGPEVRFASPESYTPKHLAERILDSKAALAGERKVVTVLFADLKGSMELLADRDPEEARRILDPVLERMMEAVHRYEGTVNQVMGDGIMALFGAPLAHEDHAVRACYAALRMQETLKHYADDTRRSHGVEVQIRVGLNSGEVVVRSVGSDLRMDYTAVGQTTHLAARMEQLAPPGTIRLTAETVRFAEGYVEVRSLGPIPVKGLPDPVELFELTGAGTARTRLQAAAIRGLTRFVGRDAEVEHLRRVLGQAGVGRGQVVAVVGEAGVGKSRLTYEFTHSHRVQDWLILEASSVSYGKATSYLPVIDLLKGYFKIGDRDDHREMRAKVLGRVLGLDRALEPMLPPLLALLDVPVEDAAWQGLDPPQRRQRTLDAVKRLLLRESQAQPLLVVFEDLHWVDGETQALLDSLVESLGSARLLLLVNYRPEYEHRWGSKTAYSQLRLDTLPAESTAELLAALLGPDLGLIPLKEMLVKRGNPFFLEETVRTLVETGALVGERGSYRLTRPVDALRVPPTVQAILAARIDRLPAEEKQLLQAASVIGKVVPYALLAAIAEQPEETLRRGLAHLQEAEFLYETQLFPDLEYTFKHALTHDVAHAGLLGERRRALHAAVVAAIERLYADRLVEHVERLAHHARQGEVWDKAVRYLRQAGAKAFLRSAHREAAAYLEQALDALQRVPEHPDAIAESLDIRFDLRTALMPLGEFGRIRALLDEAEVLAEAVSDQRRLGHALNYKAMQLVHAGNLAAALQTGHRALAIGESQADVGLQVVAHWYLGAASVVRGECREGVRHCEAAVALIPEDLRQERFGQTSIVGSSARWTLAYALGVLGRFPEAFGRLREAMQIAEEAGHVWTLLFPLIGLGALKLDQGDFAGAVAPLERGLDLCRTREMPLLLHDFAWALGVAYHGTGRRAEGVTLMENAARGVAERNRRWSGWGGYAAALGGAYLLDGRLADATRIAQDGLAAARQLGGQEVEGRLLRLLGDIAAHPDRGEADAAEAHYRQAQALAEALGLRPLVAHCHLGLGALYRRAGSRQDAREHLTTAETLFGAMDMRYWREQAEAELKNLLH
jgi:class 3 adenylate cyclase/tetratricopeptide (TPR) repeat protein